jgi:hypothetical protein
MILNGFLGAAGLASQTFHTLIRVNIRLSILSQGNGLHGANHGTYRVSVAFLFIND